MEWIEKIRTTDPKAQIGVGDEVPSRISATGYGIVMQILADTPQPDKTTIYKLFLREIDLPITI